MSLEQGPDTILVSGEQNVHEVMSRRDFLNLVSRVGLAIPMLPFLDEGDEIPEDWIPVCDIEDGTIEPFLDLVGITPVEYLNSLSNEDRDGYIEGTFFAAQTIPILAEIVEVEKLESYDSSTKIVYIDRILEALSNTESFGAMSMITRDVFRLMRPEVQEQYIENILRHVQSRANTETQRQAKGLDVNMGHCLALNDPNAMRMLRDMVFKGLTVAVATGASLFIMEDSGSLLIAWGALRFILGYPNGVYDNVGSMFRAPTRDSLSKSANPIDLQSAQEILHKSLCQLELLMSAATAAKPKQNNGQSEFKMPVAGRIPVGAFAGGAVSLAFLAFLLGIRNRSRGPASAA